MTTRHFSNAACTAAAMDRGATITSWHPRHAHEALFVTGDANPDAEFHGGIPICAPWFGQGRGVAPVSHPHGLVRWVDWQFEGARQLGEATRAAWTLRPDAYAHLAHADQYPADLRYRHEATFGRELDVALSIESPSEEVIVDDALHTYFLVNAVNTVSVHGVGERPITVSGHYDEIHLDAAGGPITIEMPDRLLVLEARGASDIVVWNPGPKLAEELPDFASSDWPRMLCVEVGNVTRNAVTIAPGGTHHLGFRLRFG